MKPIITLIASFLLSASAFADPRIYIAKLSGDGYGNAIVTVLFSSFTEEITWEETATGEFRGTCSQDEAFPTGRVKPFTWVSIDNGIASTVVELDSNRIIVYEKIGLAGDPLSGPECLVEISVYPEE